jgi:hypothetical protein
MSGSIRISHLRHGDHGALCHALDPAKEVFMSWSP